MPTSVPQWDEFESFSGSVSSNLEELANRVEALEDRVAGDAFTGDPHGPGAPGPVLGLYFDGGYTEDMSEYRMYLSWSPTPLAEYYRVYALDYQLDDLGRTVSADVTVTRLTETQLQIPSENSPVKYLIIAFNKFGMSPPASW